MASPIGEQMAVIVSRHRNTYGQSVLYKGQSFSVTTKAFSQRQTGGDEFSHIGLSNYDIAPDNRAFEFTPSDLTATGVPQPGESITWQGKVFTTIFNEPGVLGDVVIAQRVFAYYAGPIVSVAVTRLSKTSDAGLGYQTTSAAIANSPFDARVYRLRGNAYDYDQAPEGMATIEKMRVVAFLLPAPAVQVRDVCTLPDGTTGQILRLRSYPDRLDADLETGTIT